MKRYYLSKIKQVNDPGMGLVWKHRLQEITPTVEYVGGEIASNPQTGTPLHPALLVLVGSRSHAQLVADPEMVAFPQVAHDMKVSAIQTQTKAACKAEIRAMGFTNADTDNVWDNSDGMRDVLNNYGKRNKPEFDVNNFDIDES